MVCNQKLVRKVLEFSSLKIPLRCNLESSSQLNSPIQKMDTSNNCIFLLRLYFIFSSDLRYMTASLIRELQRQTAIGFLCTMIIAQILMRRRLGSQKFLNSNSVFQFSKCRLLRKFHSGSGCSRSNPNRKKLFILKMICQKLSN